jgi:predicted Zn-dependent protease with MMP-like domain
MEEVPLIVEDQPSPALRRTLGLGRSSVLCGLHEGIPLTEKSVERSAELPEQMMLFREGIFAVAADRRGQVTDSRLQRQIHITLLHEIGHHFGLDEDDLARAGYG